MNKQLKDFYSILDITCTFLSVNHFSLQNVSFTLLLFQDQGNRLLKYISNYDDNNNNVMQSLIAFKLTKVVN